MPLTYDFYFQCSNCGIKLSSTVICRRPSKFTASTPLEEGINDVKENAKKCPICNEKVEWEYLTKGRF